MQGKLKCRASFRSTSAHLCSKEALRVPNVGFLENFFWLWGGKRTILCRVTTVAKTELMLGPDCLGMRTDSCDGFCLAKLADVLKSADRMAYRIFWSEEITHNFPVMACNFVLSGLLLRKRGDLGRTSLWGFWFLGCHGWRRLKSLGRILRIETVVQVLGKCLLLQSFRKDSWIDHLHEQSIFLANLLPQCWK